MPRYTPKNWVENDKERYRETLEQPDGTAYDLTGRTANFVLRHSDGTKTVDREADAYPDRTNGVVEIVLTESELAKPGRFEAEWVITGGTDDPTTWPKDDELLVHIREDVDASDSPVNVITSTRTVTTATPARDKDVVLADASGGAFDVTLPDPGDALKVVVKKIDSSSNAVTIATPNSETIDGSASVSLTAQYASRTIVSDDTNYFII